ncbi:MAG: DUF1360 domain-containing protein [Fibrobacteria bacterium]
MDHKSIFRWLTLDMAVFFAINAVLLSLFHRELATLRHIGVFQFAILALAAYRASNILSNETVTKPLRAPFVEEVEKEGKVVEEPKKSGFLGATGLLLYCPSCTGVWLSAALVYGFAFFPVPTLAVALFLALSAIERIIAVALGRLKANS